MKKLLFVDDSPLDHYILKRTLNKYKLAYEVTCSSNCREVLEFLNENRLNADNLPDIVLLDLYMPPFDGWKFLDEIKDVYHHFAKQIKFYILSSSIDPYDIERSLQYSFVKSFMFKPITRETLERNINEAVPG